MTSSTTIEPYKRTMRDAFSILQLASIDHESVLPLTQVVYFHEKTKPYVLLEVDSDIETALNDRSELTFRGKHDEPAVLCTLDKTYELKEAETSNSLVVLDGLLYPEYIETDKETTMIDSKVVALHHGFMELKKTKARLSHLWQMLNRNPYNGPELEPSTYSLQDGFYTTSDFLKELQTSEIELIGALKELDSFIVSGFWRRLGLDYHFRGLSFITSLIEENSWPLYEIPLSKLCSELRVLLPEPVLNFMLELYFNPTGDISDDGEELFSLKAEKVARTLGEFLLVSGNKFALGDFMTTWSDSVPSGIEINLRLIEDLAIIKRQRGNEILEYFPESQLPENVADRFSHLFNAKEKWLLDEIKPYLKNVCFGKQDISVLLTKYARHSVNDGITYYSSRY